MARSKTQRKAASPAPKQKRKSAKKRAGASKSAEGTSADGASAEGTSAEGTLEAELLQSDPPPEIAGASLDLPVPPPRSKALVRRDDRALERRDPLQIYMAEVHRHPLLSRAEELELAQKFRSTGDLKAAYRLVASNLRLVVKIANEYHRNPLSLLDLIQEGNIGLMQAVKKYDPGRGVKLSSYAAWWIRAYVLRYIMDNWRLVKLGTTEAQRKLFFKLRQEQDRLVSQGFEATPKLLAERLNVTERDVVEMDQRLGHDEVSLDAPIGEDGTTTRGDRFLPSDTVPADIRLGNEELKRIFSGKLEEFAKGLQDKERFIFEKRLMSDEPLTLQEIGDNYGISRERARQIEANLISRIRNHVRKEMPDFDLQ